MNFFDLRTILLSHIITNAICIVMVAFLWFRDRKRFDGLGYWLAAFVMQFTAILLVALRNTIPDFWSIVVGNTLVVAGIILLYMGLERFVGKRTSQIHNYLLLTAFVFIHAYFAFLHPSLLARAINLTAGIILLCAQCAWLLIYRVDAEIRPITHQVGYVFVTFCLFAMARIVADLMVNPGNDFLEAGVFEALAFLINQTLLIILTFGLLWMVNRRLITDLKRDIVERQVLEASLQHRSDILAASHQVMLDLMNQRNADDMLQTLLAKIGTLLSVSDVSIDLIENSDTLVTYAATPSQPLTKGDTMRRGEGGWLSWQAVDNEQPAILEDYSTWPQRRELYEGFSIHALAIIPIHHLGRVIGTINFSRREANKPFTDTDIYVSEQLAQVVALVLDNAQLYTQLQSELAERKRMEADLRESQENFQRYFNMSTVGMCVTTPDRHWIEANGRLRQMLGYSDEELDHFTWGQITHPDDLASDLPFYNQILANERDSYQVDKRFIHKDGSTVYTTLFVTCHRNPDGTVRYLLASLVDITDRKQAEESLLKLAAIEERQRLARDLHDSVNQSIHGLVLFSETLVSTLEKANSDRARQIADRLQESARQALKETRLMLYELREASPVRSIDLIPDLEARLATVERRAGVKARIFQEGSLAYCPQAWHENLFWIAMEALNNALKHAQARNVQIKICCSPNHMELEIVDDGIGFDSDKPRLGGLGLQNMRDRASLIGGELTILSTPPKGSCVRLRAEIKE